MEHGTIRGAAAMEGTTGEDDTSPISASLRSSSNTPDDPGKPLAVFHHTTSNHLYDYCCAVHISGLIRVFVRVFHSNNIRALLTAEVATMCSGRFSWVTHGLSDSQMGAADSREQSTGCELQRFFAMYKLSDRPFYWTRRRA